jgi:hypothetical protein
MEPVKDKWTMQNNAISALKRLLAEGVGIHTVCSRLGDVYHWGIVGKGSCLWSTSNDYRKNNLAKYYDRFSPRDLPRSEISTITFILMRTTNTYIHLRTCTCVKIITRTVYSYSNK